MNKLAKPYHHGTLKKDLIDTTVNIITTRGHIDFNLREIAKECGVSAPAVYRHFPSKNYLLIEIAKIGFIELLDLFKLHMQKEKTKPQKRLEEIGKIYINYAIDNEGYFRVMFSRELRQLVEYVEIEDIAEKTFEAFQSALNSASKTSKRKTGIFEIETLKAWALVHGLSHLWIGNNLQVSRKKFNEQIEHILKNAYL